MTKRLSAVLLSFIMLLSITSAVPITAQAASLPKTSISSLTAYPSGFNVNMKSQKNITGYQVQYSTSSKFKNAKSVKTKKTTSELRKLSSSKKYYVRVRTYKTSGKKTTYSAWSSSKSITTLNKNASNPAHIKSITAQHAGFKVQTYTSSNAAGYQVRYATKSDMSNAKTNTVKGKKNTTITVMGRATNTKYYVQTRTFRTVNGKNYYSAWSPSKTVKTQIHNYKTPVYTTKKVKIKDAWDEPIYETQKVLVKDAWDEPVYEKHQADYCDACYMNITEYAIKYNMSLSKAETQHRRPDLFNYNTQVPACQVATDGNASFYFGERLGLPNFIEVQVDTIHHDAEYEDKKVQVGTKHHDAVYENKKVVTGYKCSCGAVKKS